ncbi:MAG TPA: ATP-binding protein [Candidatus Saccharimonadales bacterium]|nr:ATP-binding protein [Candidatus Saccharimonadales bacterium]
MFGKLRRAKPVVTRIIPAAKLEHERLTSLINSMADGVLAVDQNGRVVLYNGAALDVLDLNTSMNGKPLAEVFRPIDKNNQKVDVEALVRNTRTAITSRDLLLPYADGSKINLYLSIAPVHLGYASRKRASQSGYILLLRDITREKSLEEERDEFISVVSHELRTPIAIAEGNISNALFLSSKTGDIKQIRAALKQSHDQILFLADMINDLATLSRAERGKLTVEINEINVNELVRSLARNYTASAANKKLTLNVAAKDNLGTLFSSELYVREILQNFITNAIKYTEQGSVTIGARREPTGIMFSVADTGIGISKGDQEKVFDKFFRSEDFRTRKTNGTGLGLYVTMKLAHLLHADIELTSKLNHGSTFTIFIPNLK